MPSAVLSVGTDETLILRSGYDRAFVEALKAALPSYARAWDAAARVWRIDPDWGDVVLQVAQGCGLIALDKRPIAPPPLAIASALQHACQVLGVLPDAPMEVAEAAFKARAKRCHPDVGGDTAVFQALNEAYTTFKSFNEVPC